MVCSNLCLMDQIKEDLSPDQLHGGIFTLVLWGFVVYYKLENDFIGETKV